ncbi:hypothetical protein AX774_g6542 [Zancudomyces culisetae]|uniref:PH domain-containing protein n=1 Tax=Zancudomyces culisetae TaxID=1213189 RepID=A0A1R1PGD1_ZANCU|nr:hypothetical protein AX774_g6542 [Zancudomyces culisetae]|eukprot:OMH80040.1 hypothetical protein AX774_g6542 [Zancudomyces culisetae]
MSFSKSILKKLGAKGKAATAVPHEFLYGSKSKKNDVKNTQEPDDAQSIAPSVSESLDTTHVQSKAADSVGTGGETDLIYLRMRGLRQLVKSYIQHFESLAKAYKQTLDTFQKGQDIFNKPLANDFLFLPNNEGGILSCASSLQSFLSDQLRLKAQAGLNAVNNVLANLEAYKNDIKAKMNDYNSRLGLIYSNLTKCKSAAETTQQALEKAMEMLKIESEAPKAGDPYLLNLEMKSLIARRVDMENTLYLAIQSELKNLADWEVTFLQSMQALIAGFFDWEAKSNLKTSEAEKKIADLFSSAVATAEWSGFVTKYKDLLEFPQNCDGKSNVSNYKYTYMDHSSLRIIKKGRLQREDIGYGISNKFKDCQAVITETGFMHLFDEVSGIQKNAPNLTIYLPSVSLAPIDTPDLPRSALLLYTKKGSAKSTALTATISNKTKYLLKAEDYVEMKEWWKIIDKYTTASVSEILQKEEIVDKKDNVSAIGLPAIGSATSTKDDASVFGTTRSLHSSNIDSQYLLTGTNSIGFGQPGHVFSYQPVQQPDGQIVYIPVVQHTAVEEPSGVFDPSQYPSGIPQYGTNPHLQSPGFGYINAGGAQMPMMMQYPPQPQQMMNVPGSSQPGLVPTLPMSFMQGMPSAQMTPQLLQSQLQPQVQPQLQAQPTGKNDQKPDSLTPNSSSSNQKPVEGQAVSTEPTPAASKTPEDPASSNTQKTEQASAPKEHTVDGTAAAESDVFHECSE